MPVHLFFNAFYLFYSSVSWFISITPFNSLGILENKKVCPTTWGNNYMNCVSVLIFRPDLNSFLCRENAFSWYNEVFLKNQMSLGIYCYNKSCKGEMILSTSVL